MNANVATFYAAPAYNEMPARPAAGQWSGLLARFVKHMFSGGAPVWHVATIGSVMTQMNGRKG